MRCRKVPKLLSLGQDGVLGARRAADLDRHLASCPGCRLAARRLERSWDLLARLDPPGPAPDDWSAIEAAVERRRRRWVPAWLEPDFAPTRAATVALLLLMVAVGGAVGVVAGRVLPSGRPVALESQVIAETLGELPWSSPASGLGPLLAAGEAREGRP